MKRITIPCALVIGASSGVSAFVVSSRQAMVSLSPIKSAVPYIPDGYSQKEWQTEHEAELAELQSRKEEYIGHRGAAAQPVRHLSEDIDAKTHVHFHKPLSSNGSDGRAADDEGETVLQKMRRQWGRDDDSLIP